ncbi:MAG TPA: hypothetical protein VH880_05130 [Anaeromyxobacteraceae bacterium]
MRTRLAVPLVALAGFALSACPPAPVGVESLKKFAPASATPLTATGVAADQGGWRIDPAGAGPVRLFELAGSTCEACRLVYRARVKTLNLPAPAYLEMWVRAPDKGEFFSRGLDQKVTGSIDWTSVEIPFFFQKGERADLVKLNVSFQGAGGSLWIKDVELLKGPLP